LNERALGRSVFEVSSATADEDELEFAAYPDTSAIVAIPAIRVLRYIDINWFLAKKK
jgi:hypothetical protein